MFGRREEVISEKEKVVKKPRQKAVVKKSAAKQTSGSKSKTPTEGKTMVSKAVVKKSAQSQSPIFSYFRSNNTLD